MGRVPIDLLVPFIFSCLFALILTPIVRVLALKTGLVDLPNARRLNKIPMPSGGGIVVFLAFFATVFLFTEIEVLPFLLGGVVIVFVGLLDDYRGLSPLQKFIGQLVAVSLYIAFGSRIEFMPNPFGGIIELGVFSVLVTGFWFISVINVINFIDGLDGLASGIVIIASVALFSIAFDFGRIEVATLILIFVGSVAGFIPYNFNPAKIYLGDAGAMFLGFMSAGLAVEGVLKGTNTVGIGIAALVLAVPITDAFCAIVRRVIRNVPFYQADKHHFHHRLLELGFNQRQVALCAYMITFVSAAMALQSVQLNSKGFWIPWVMAIIFLYGATKVGLIKPTQVGEIMNESYKTSVKLGEKRGY